MDVYVVDLEGGAPERVTQFQGDELVFSHGWTPDGLHLIAQRGVNYSDIVLLENLPLP